MIPESEWEWFGSPAHLIVGEDCRFHLATKVGKFLISTVGEYFPDYQAREIFAETRGVVLEGRGDDRRLDYMRKIGFEDIGAGRKYETMVFPVGDGVCTCGCGIPRPIDWSGLASNGYNDANSATKGHMVLCKEWAKVR